VPTRRFILAVHTAVAWIALLPAQAQTYNVVTLPLPPGASGCVARAINASGHIAGYLIDSTGKFQAVTWIDGVVTVLPLAPGYPGANALGISDAGIVCGSAWTNGSFGLSAAVMWQNGSVSFIPTFGGARSAANAISPSGTVTGWTSTYADIGGQRAFRFSNSSLISAGVLPGNGSSWTHAYAINASGQLAGTGMTASRFGHAFLADPVEGTLDLGTLGGVTSDALAISNAGHVAGFSQTGVRNPAVYYGIVEHAFLWHKGKLTDLGVLPGLVESRADGVNSAGLVVGRCTGATWGSTPTAFVWNSGTLTRLDDVIPAGTGWTLQNAYAIHDSGRIVGSGLLAGQTRAFVLLPNR
jgi:probable HAF family extracellular repeat protein